MRHCIGPKRWQKRWLAPLLPSGRVELVLDDLPTSCEVSRSLVLGCLLGCCLSGIEYGDPFLN